MIIYYEYLKQLLQNYYKQAITVYNNLENILQKLRTWEYLQFTRVQ